MKDNLKHLGIQSIPIILNFLLIDSNLFIGFIIVFILSILNVVFSKIVAEELIDNDNKWIINAIAPIGLYIISFVICTDSIFGSIGFDFNGLSWFMLQPIVVISLIIGLVIVCKTEKKYNKNDSNDKDEE